MRTSPPGSRLTARLSPLVLTALVLVAGGCAGYDPSGVVRAEGHEAYAVGDYEAALERYEELKRRDPRSARARYEVAKALLALGRAQEAADEAELAVRLDPSKPAHVDLYAEALSAAGREETLFTFLQRRAAQRGEPGDYLRLGRHLLEHGRPDEAHEALLRAAELDGGESVEPQIALARFYREIGDEQREVERLRAVLYLQERNLEAIERLRALGYQPEAEIAVAPPEAE